MKYLLYVLGFCLLLTSTIAYEITEIMYDPVGSDSQREWVEVYGLPLEGLEFLEGGNVHALELVQGNCIFDCVSIIADDAQLFLEEYSIPSHVLLYDSSWASLKNTGENIGLSNDGTILVEYEYVPYGPLGNSLQYVFDTYISAQPTPGFVAHQEESVPEFSVVASCLLLLGAGIVVFRNRQD